MVLRDFTRMYRKSIIRLRLWQPVMNLARTTIRILVTSSSIVGALSCSSSSRSESSSDRAGTIKWGSCRGENAPQAPFECGFLAVPLDYSNPDGDKLSIALVRIPASDEKQYEGAILLNPGGPGGSGFDSLVNEGKELRSKLDLGAFDLIGFDPRGVDRSGGLRCASDAEMDRFLYYDSTPDNETEQAIFDEFENDESTCEEKLGPSITHYSTENIARDMDLIRSELQLEKINYLGISYGTYLGGVYATLFPDRVESMILDAAFDPQGDTEEERYLTQAVGFEKAFEKWTKWCEEETDCAFHAKDVEKKWNTLYSRLDKESDISTSGRDVNHKVMMSATKYALYTESDWPLLADALQQAEEGKPDSLLELADWDNHRQEDGTYSTLNDSFYVISCASGFQQSLPKNPQELVSKLKQVAPWYSREKEASDFEEPWCEKAFENQKLFEINYQGNAPILIIGGENDPATPIRWAEEMTLNMGTNASLLRFTGEGHSQILESKCVDTIAKDLFTRKMLPTSNTVCSPDKPIPKPDWWSEIPPEAIFGTPISTKELEAFLGAKDTDLYSENRAVRGDLKDIFTKIYTSFDNANFSTDCESKVSPIEKPCFFWKLEGNYIGVTFYTVTEIKKWKLNQSDIPIPAGTHLVTFYYWP